MFIVVFSAERKKMSDFVLLCENFFFPSGSGFPGDRDDEEDARRSPGGASHQSPPYHRMDQRGELGSSAAGGEPHPSVEAVGVHLRRSPGAGFRC